MISPWLLLRRFNDGMHVLADGNSDAQETQMLNDDVQVVFKLDAKLSSHPIVQYVDHPDAITELFDK